MNNVSKQKGNNHLVIKNFFRTAEADSFSSDLTMRLLAMKPSSSAFSMYIFCGLLVLFSLCGCASLKDMFDFSADKKADTQLPAEALTAKGLDEFNIGRYYMADTYFTEILDRYPFSPQAMLAELKSADCKYFMDKFYEALLLYKQFEERHPTNEAIPYVMYQKGMCNYNRIDTIDRDPDGAVQTIQDFSQLLRAFPDSPYTEEAKARIRAANEFLVNHEYFVVKFYLKAEKFSEAEARLKYIVAMYPDAMIVPRAKDLLARIQAGNPPKSGIAEWFSDLSLPSWRTFFSHKAAPPASPKKGK
jgi:outer membrane protein assembly factor BamD